MNHAWPPLLAIATAAKYCQISTSALRHAVRRGELRIAGRRGGRGVAMFERVELDRWLRGEPIEPRQPASRRSAPGDSNDAVARIDRLARGGK